MARPWLKLVNKTLELVNKTLIDYLIDYLIGYLIYYLTDSSICCGSWFAYPWFTGLVSGLGSRASKDLGRQQAPQSKDGKPNP